MRSIIQVFIVINAKFNYFFIHLRYNCINLQVGWKYLQILSKSTDKKMVFQFLFEAAQATAMTNGIWQRIPDFWSEIRKETLPEHFISFSRD